MGVCPLLDGIRQWEQMIWEKFDTLDRTDEEIVWKYVNALYLCYEKEYDKLDDLMNSV